MDIGTVMVAATLDLISNIFDFKQWRLRDMLRHKCAHSYNARQYPFVGQLPHSAVGGHTTDAKLPRQFVIRRDSLAGDPLATFDMPENMLLYF